MSETRYDIVYGSDGMRPWIDVQPHFCREWDGDEGCYGTNPDHGFSYDEAKEEAARWHEEQAKFWRESRPPEEELQDAAEEQVK